MALLPSFSALAQKSRPSITLLEVFDVPHSQVTNPMGINGRNDIAGFYQTTSGIEGFIRNRSGRFTALTFPESVGTYSEDINKSSTVCGFYVDAESNAHGFFQTGGTYSSFDVEGAISTALYGINDAGDFVGIYLPEAGIYQPFVDGGGVMTPITIPDSTSSSANAISSAGVVVGNYRTAADTRNQGFIRDAAGNLTLGIEIPGSVSPGTYFLGINSRGWIVGNYWDGDSELSFGHGFLLMQLHGFITYDFPNANTTYLTGISDQGLVCGYYVDTGGQAHGILLQAR